MTSSRRIADHIDLVEAVRCGEEHVRAALNETKTMSSERMHPIFVVGLPRSGTTLVSQAMARRFNVGYSSNIAALFVSAPLVGALVHQRFHTEVPPTPFESSFGQTTNAMDVHEYGRFWRGQFGLQTNEIPLKASLADPARTASTLRDVARIHNSPTIWKCFYALTGYSSLIDALPELAFVVVKRPLRSVATSLLRGSLAQGRIVGPTIEGEGNGDFRDPRFHAKRALRMEELRVAMLSDVTLRAPTIEVSIEDVVSASPHWATSGEVLGLKERSVSAPMGQDKVELSAKALEIIDEEIGE